jgi:hypothetical protein
MAKLIFGMQQSLDGYVDHVEFRPGPALFRHFVEHVRDLAGGDAPELSDQRGALDQEGLAGLVTRERVHQTDDRAPVDAQQFRHHGAVDDRSFQPFEGGGAGAASIYLRPAGGSGGGTNLEASIGTFVWISLS